jgi:hypothetical protein
MANINTDTQELDKKKAQQNSVSNSTKQIFKNTWSFLISTLFILSIVIGYVFLSSIVLYECKLAQSNILPTILECYPYTSNNVDIEKINTNIFISNTEPPSSAKLNFPYDKYNSKNIILDMFRKYKEHPRSSFLTNYVIAILEGLINHSNNAFTIFFNFLNTLPEILIVTIGPIISLVYFGLMQIMGLFVFIYYYFSEMKWFFKENVNTDSNSKPVWKDVGITSPVNAGIAMLLVFCFFILFWILLFTVTPIAVIFIFYACLFMTFGYKCEFNNKNATMFTIIQETFKYYKVTITTLLSILIIMNTFTNLGAIPGVISLFTILLIYYKYISIGIFDPVKTLDTSPLSTLDQAIKKCMNTPKPKTFMDTIGNLFDFKGGAINNELKKLNKKLQKI